MSVNLELVPKVLALKALMGEENFNDWVRSLQIWVPTNCSDKNTLIKYIKKADYDAQEWGNSLKTHINGENEFFFWDYVDGKWVAIFSNSLSQSTIKNFIEKIEMENSKEIFLSSSDFSKDPFKIFEYPTNFNDHNLIIKTLKENGLDYEVELNGEIVLNLSGTNIIFYQNDDEPYTVKIVNPGNINQVFSQLSLLDDDYKNNVQADTYENLKKNLKDRDLDIESEEILDDDSIVITVNLNQGF